MNELLVTCTGLAASSRTGGRRPPGGYSPFRIESVSWSVSCCQMGRSSVKRHSIGSRGGGHKTFFYAFYPAHIYVFYALSCGLYALLN